MPHPLLPIHHYDCFPCNFFNVGISPKTFLASSFNLFAKYVQNIKAVPSASPRSMNLNQTISQKKIFFFGSNPYKIEVIINSLTEMLE